MKKKIFVLFLMFLFVGFSNAQKNQNTSIKQYWSASYKIVMNGDAISGIRNNIPAPVLKTAPKNKIKSLYGSPLYNTTFTYTGCWSTYDLVSNATPQNIIQDPSNPARIHIVCMSAPAGDPPTFPNRKSKYYYSTNYGTSWLYLGNAGPRSGFPVITLAPNGNALIGNHNTNIAYTSKFYYDAMPGLGSFTELYSSTLMDYLWPRVVFTSSLVNTNKFLSIQAPNGRDSCFIIRCTSLNPSPGTFTAYSFINSDQAETYSIARGSDGRIGIVYHNNDVLFAADYGDLFFMESTDNGTTFGSPTKIFNADMGPLGDSLASLRGLQIVYQGNIPKVAFEVVKQTTTWSYYRNDGGNHIRLWSTSLPGSDPNRSIKIADTGNVGYHPYINTGSGNSDVLTNICRPTIGVSADGTGLFVAFMVPSDYTGGTVDTISFMDVYIMHSTNYGSNWFAPVRINSYSPLRDWTFPCISPTNDNNTNNYYVNLLMLSDSLPGTNLNSQTNGESGAKYMFVRVEVPKGFILPPPVLIYPPNGALNVPQPVRFDWSDVIGAAAYDLQISRDYEFTKIIYSVYGDYESEYLLNNGNFGDSTYYWRVRATNGDIKSQWSSVWSFTFASGALPSAPTLIYPLNGATGVPQPITFDWSDASGASSYIFQIAINSGFTQLIYSVSNIIGSQYLLPNGIISASGTYFWRVFGTNNIGNGPSSEIWSFTCSSGNPPPAPVLLTPQNGASCVSVTPTFDWQDATGAASYRLQVSTVPTFATTTINVSTVSSQYTVPAGILANNTQYYWRVNATNIYGTGEWSNTLVFITMPTTPLPATLIAPPNGSTNIPLTPMLYWNSSSGATSYRLQLSQSSSFTVLVFDSVTTSTQITIPPGILNNISVYYWRVSVINCAGNGPWSSIWVFVTNSSGINLYSTEVPTEFKLYNNFPNPFNPATKIRFDLPKTSDTKIIVFDILGKEVATLINKTLTPGKFEIEWNASSLPSGVYFYKLETEDFSCIKRLVLIK